MAGRRDIEAGRAFVRLGLKDGLKGPLRKSLKEAGDFAKQFAAAAIAAFSGVTAAASAAVAEFVSAGVELKKLATQTGSTVEELSALQHVANRTNVDFDDMIGAMEELNIRLGEAVRDGSGPLLETFEKLGISVDEFRRKNFTEQLISMREQFQGMDRAARGFQLDEIFGGDAFKIISAIESDIESLTKDAERFGLVMSSDTADAAAEVGRAMKDLMDTIKGSSREFAQAVTKTGDMASALERVAAAIESIDWEAFGKGARGVAGVLETISKGLSRIASIELTKQFEKLNEAVREGEATQNRTPEQEERLGRLREMRDRNLNAILDVTPTRDLHPDVFRAQELMRRNREREDDSRNNLRRQTQDLLAKLGARDENRINLGGGGGVAEGQPVRGGTSSIMSALSGATDISTLASGFAKLIQPNRGGRYAFRLQAEQMQQTLRKMFTQKPDGDLPAFAQTPDAVQFSARAASAAAFGGESEVKQQTKLLREVRDENQRLSEVLSQYVNEMRHG